MLGEGTGTDSVRVLRRGDGDREDADSVGGPGRRFGANCPSEGTVIM